MLSKKNQKINTYLLENHPNLWHVRMPFMLVSGVILHLLSFIYGYLYLTPRTLANYSSFYEGESYYLLYFIIAMIIIGFYWGLNFYKNSVLKHFYRAGKFYLVKMYFLIVALFFFHLSAILTFNVGISIAKKQIVQTYDTAHLQKEYEFLKPLFFTANEDYHLEDNLHLKEEGISFQYVGEDVNISYLFFDRKTQQKYIADTTGRYDLSLVIPTLAIDSSHYSTVGNSSVIFYRTEERDSVKGCFHTYLKEFIKLTGYNYSSIKNHAEYSSELDELIQAEKWDELTTRMTKFKSHINRMYDFTNYNPWVILSYLKAKKGLNISSIIANQENSSASMGPSIFKGSTLDYLDENLNVYSMENAQPKRFFFDVYRLENFLNNAFYPVDYYSTFLVILIVSLFLTFFLLQFQYIQFVNFAISIPIMAALFVLGILFTIFAFVGSGGDIAVPAVFSGFWAAVFSVMLAYSERMSIRKREVLLVLQMILVPITVLVGYAAIGDAIYRTKEKIDPCYPNAEIYAYFDAPPFYEWHFILLGIFCAIGLLFLVKKTVAKYE